MWTLGMLELKVKKRSKVLTKLQIGDFVLDHVEVPNKSFSPRDISGGPVLGCRRLSSDDTQAGSNVRGWTQRGE